MAIDGAFKKHVPPTVSKRDNFIPQYEPPRATAEGTAGQGRRKWRGSALALAAGFAAGFGLRPFGWFAAGLDRRRRWGSAMLRNDPQEDHPVTDLDRTLRYGAWLIEGDADEGIDLAEDLLDLLRPVAIGGAAGRLLPLERQGFRLHELVPAEELAPAHSLALEDLGQRRERRLLLVVLDARELTAAESRRLAEILQGQFTLLAQPPESFADQLEHVHAGNVLGTTCAGKHKSFTFIDLGGRVNYLSRQACFLSCAYRPCTSPLVRRQRDASTETLGRRKP